MKISIVTISFNQAKYLEEAIASVLNQNCRQVEYIVVDPGSTDGSRDIIEKYRHRIDHIIYEKDRGPADGLNKGFDHATGDIFGFLNADDILEDGALQSVASFFERHLQIDVVSGHSWVIDEAGRARRRLFSEPFSSARAAFGFCTLSQASTFFRAQAFRRSKGFNADNRISWDGELFADMALTGARFEIMPEFLSRFRVHNDSITGSGKGRKLGPGYNYELQKRVFRKTFERDPPKVYPLLCFFARYLRKILNPRDTFERIFKGPISR